MVGRPSVRVNSEVSEVERRRFGEVVVMEVIHVYIQYKVKWVFCSSSLWRK